MNDRISYGQISHDQISHDLRTPLACVYGFTATLVERWEAFDDEQRLAMLELVHEQTLRLVRGVEKLDRWIEANEKTCIAA